MTGTAGTAITLETLGGSGKGAVTFTVSGTECSVSGTSLNATAAATCIVTASKAASTDYLAARSVPKTFEFTAATVAQAQAQATLTVSNTTLTGTAGTAITLETLGGTGGGAVTFTVTTSGCVVSGTLLKATAAVTCSVKATKAASTGYLAATSEPKTFTFTAVPVAQAQAQAQATLTVSNTTTGKVGRVITLETLGGSGGGAVTFTVTGSGCRLIGTSLSATTAVTCSVTATKAASTGYLEATSAKAIIKFVR